jgi:hypothetical protein
MIARTIGKRIVPRIVHYASAKHNINNNLRQKLCYWENVFKQLLNEQCQQRLHLLILSQMHKNESKVGQGP